MATVTFSDYITSRPTATNPLTSTDQILVLQGGSIKIVSSLNAGYEAVNTVLINASTTPMTTLPNSGEIVYQKSDSSSDIAYFQVGVVGQTMCQELQNGLSGEGESIRVKLIGTKWYNIE